MSQVTRIVCAQCSTVSEKPSKEIERQIRHGAKRFFCSRSCACKAGNERRLAISISLTCLRCGNDFRTTTKAHAAKYFCSRGCASAGSVTERRRQSCRELAKKNFIHEGASHTGMLRREGWKYTELKERLDALGMAHVFEEKLAGAVLAGSTRPLPPGRDGCTISSSMPTRSRWSLMLRITTVTSSL